jgi:hypothetical protein
MQQTAGEIDLAPFEPTELADAQAMPVGDEDHRAIAVAVAAALASRDDQRLDLGWGQIFAWPAIDVALSTRWPRRLTHHPQLNCTIPAHWSPLAAGMLRQGLRPTDLRSVLQPQQKWYSFGADSEKQ